MGKITNEYILWVYNGQGGYSPHGFDTVEAAMMYERYSSDWYLTRNLNDFSFGAYYKKPKVEEAPTKN